MTPQDLTQLQDCLKVIRTTGEILAQHLQNLLVVVAQTETVLKAAEDILQKSGSNYA